MSNQFRFRSGQMSLRKVRVDSSTVIEVGDLVFLDTDDVKPASAFTWDTNLATTQSAFAAVFLGIAHEASASGETDPISVDTSPLSVYEMDVASGAYEIGDELGPDESSSTLSDQQLEAVGSGATGIAFASEYNTSGATKLRVQFKSAFHAATA